MSDEGTPTGPPKFPPVEEPPPPPSWPQTGQGWPPPGPDQSVPPGPAQGGPYGRPGGHWLHPLDVGRAFSSSWRLFKLRWKPMVGAILAVSLPVAIVSGLLQGWVIGPAMAEWTQQYLDALRTGDLSGVPLPPASASLAYVIAIASGIFGLVGNAAVITIVDASYRGGTAGAGDGLRAAFRRIVTLIGILFALFGLFIGIALIGALLITLLVVVGALIAAIVFFALRWSLAPQVAMVEGVGALKSLGRSWRLIDGSTWRLLGYYLLIGLVLIGFVLLTGLIVGIIQTIFFGPSFRIENGQVIPLSNPVALFMSSIFSSLALAIITPWWVTLLTLFYFDLRWRRGEQLPGDATTPAATA
jgi:hypothetical protein